MDFIGKENIVELVQTKLGLKPDGVDGPTTWNTIAAKFGVVPNAKISQISDKAFNLIIKYEVGGGEAYYNKYLKKPSWPGAFSGVTIGVGYDLGYNRTDELYSTWQGKISDETLKRLKPAIGVNGGSAKAFVKTLKDIEIPWSAALEVFKEHTLPRFESMTITTYPKSEELHPDAFGALVSLVFNRGSSLSGARRVEMANIKKLVPSKNYAAIAHEIRKMKRLWIGAGVDGLLKRREDEAKLVESCAV